MIGDFSSAGYCCLDFFVFAHVRLYYILFYQENFLLGPGYSEQLLIVIAGHYTCVDLLLLRNYTQSFSLGPLTYTWSHGLCLLDFF